MAKNNDNILEKARQEGLARPSAGMSLPNESYFDDFAAQMAASLPARPEIESENSSDAKAPQNLWQKVRTYVYMAAMFAGIWCMMQMFVAISGTGKLLPIEQNDIIASAMSNEDFLLDYVYDNYSDDEIVDEIIAGDDGNGSVALDFNQIFNN